ncbi:MAG: TMEM165/GDT1 family protein [Promethearchaeia archaeon]
MDWIGFFTVFGILFLAELGDKTQLMVFNLSLEYKKSFKVAVGSILGFGLIITLGILLGEIITSFIPLSLITTISGILFLLLGLIGIKDLKTLYQEYIGKKQKVGKSEQESEIPLPDTTSKFSKIRDNPYLVSFSLIFLMELGDKSQILTITLASIYPNPIEVWIGAILALSLLTLMGAYFGDFISRLIPKFHLKIFSIAIFVIIGIVVIIT